MRPFMPELSSRRAIILAGGKGIRLRPYTVMLPKPLMPLGDYPILEVIIRQLATAGFDHITLAVNYLSEVIRSFCGDGSRWGVHIDYSRENEPLGTVGPLGLIDDLPEDFLVMNGDILTNLDYRHLYEQHLFQGSECTVAAYERSLHSEFGLLETDATGELLAYHEKPRQTQLVSMGIYVMSRSVVPMIPPSQPYGCDRLLNELIRQGRPPQVEVHDGYWLDIGCPEDYRRAVQEFGRMADHFLVRV